MWARLVRLFKHRWTEDAVRVLDTAALVRLQQRVATSEHQHSGEIRLCIEAGLPNHYLLSTQSMAQLSRRRAVDQFGELRVWDTEYNNGVLIYLLLAEHTIEVVADRGLNALVTQAQWADMVQRLATAMQSGQVEAGLARAIDEVSALLQLHFPAHADKPNPNELPDAPVLR